MYVEDALEQFVFGEREINSFILIDYGFYNCEKLDDNWYNLIGIYKGIFISDVDKQALGEACTNGKLAEFIDEYYKGSLENKYYTWFKTGDNYKYFNNPYTK
jgi:hypothetical protein